MFKGDQAKCSRLQAKCLSRCYTKDSRFDYGDVQNLSMLPKGQNEEEQVMTINHPYCSSLFSEFKYNNVTPPYEIVSQDTLGMKDDTIAGFI